MRILPALLGLVVASCLTGSAFAQSKARIFDVKLGTPVSELPAEEWVDPSCGTNGGPPSTRLASFEDFARCRVEPETGLREIWFIYDDEWEYIARAYRDPVEIRSYSANVFYAQPIVTSLLVDENGLVQGYRVVTDDRAPVLVRREAYALHLIFQTLFDQGPWHCTKAPLEAREHTVEGKFVKSSCVMASDELYAKIEGRLLRKPGQDRRDIPGLSERAEGDFESTSRLEVYAADAVRKAPCCTASATQ